MAITKLLGVVDLKNDMSAAAQMMLCVMGFQAIYSIVILFSIGFLNLGTIVVQLGALIMIILSCKLFS